MTVTLAYPGAVGGVEPAAEKNEILAGQAHNFRRQLLVIGMVKAVNAGLLGGVFYAYVNPYLLSAWIVAVWYLAFLCIRSWWRHRDRIDETAPKPGYIERAIRSTYVSGILWGVGAAILFLPESIPHQLFLVFLIGGMAAGTTAGLSTLPNAWIGYVLPSMLPLVASLAIVGESIQLGMAGLLLVYTAALFWMSRFNYATFVSGVRSRMRIAELAREVAESRTKLDDAISSISDGFILFDADDKIVTCNEQFRKLYNFVADLCVPGMSFERVCRAAAWRLDVADTDYGKDAWVQRRVALHRNARDSSDIELGDGRWVRVSERRTADGGIVGVHTDITEKRQAEEALRESEQRLQSLAENLPGFVFQRHLKTDGSIEHPFVSAGVKEIYGITAEDAIANSRAFLDTVHPADRDALMAAVQRSAEKVEPMDRRYRIASAGRTRWVRMRARPRRLDDGSTMWDGVSLDDTEYKLTEDRAREHEAELARVLRVTTLGEMTSALAHQLNQPLNAVANYTRGVLRRMRSGTSDSEELAGIMEQACEQAERAAVTVRSLADFVRKTERKFDICDVNAMVKTVIDLVRVEVDENRVRLEIDLEPNLPTVEIVAIEIEQSILNLVRNGIEAMSEVHPMDRAMRISTSHREGMITIAITDSGCGLLFAVLAKMFDPFFSTKSDSMGMGLSITRTIIEAHGGSIRASQNEDQGATLHVSLPARG